MGRFYLFFMRLGVFFVTVLCRLVRMWASVREMNKLAPQSVSKSFAMSTAFHSNLEPVQHLVVLVSAYLDYSTATRQIWELANATGVRVLLLGLCRNESEEPSLRRGLATMSAMMQTGKVSTDIKIEIGTSWVDAVKRNYQPGDMVVCFAEQRAGVFHKPLSQILSSRLTVPMYILSVPSPQKFNPSWATQLIVWSGFIGIVIGFGILQLKIVQLPRDWFQNVLFILSTVLEFWLIGVWNNLFH